MERMNHVRHLILLLGYLGSITHASDFNPLRHEYALMSLQAEFGMPSSSLPSLAGP